MENIQRCPCCMIGEDCPSFQNAVNIKDIGLVIYRYSPFNQSVNIHTGKKESLTETLILHNTKNIDIASEKLIPKLDQYTKCPRCKYILEHAKQFLHNVPTINKLDVLGICDKCRTKDRKAISSCECSEAIKMFISSKKYKEKKAQEDKQRNIKLQNLLDRFIKKDETFKDSYDRIGPESNLKNISLEPIINKNWPKLIESKAIQQGRISFAKTTDVIKFTRKNYSDTELSKLDILRSNIIFHNRSDDNINSLVQDVPFLKASLKNNLKYPLSRVSISHESSLNFYDVTDETTKSRPLYKISGQYEKYPHQTYVQKDNRDKEQKSILDLIAEQKEISRGLDITETPKKTISLTSDMETGTLKTKTDPMESYRLSNPSDISLLVRQKDLLHKDFSYFFLKEAKAPKNTLQKSKSSSELIKDTQDMLLAREEEFKKVYNEKLIRKFDEAERKKITLKRMRRLEKSVKAFDQKPVPDANEILMKEKDSSAKKVKKDTQAPSDKRHKHDTNTDPKVDVNLGKSQKEKKVNLGLQKEQKPIEEKKIKTEKAEKSKKEKENKKDELSIREIDTRGKHKNSTLVPGKNRQPVKVQKIREEPRDFSLGGKDKKILEKEKAEPGGKEKDKLERHKNLKSTNEELKREKEEKPGLEFGIENQIKNSPKKQQLEPIIEEGKQKSEKKKVHSVDKTKAKEEAALKLKALREIKSDSEESKLNISQPEKKTEEPKIKELNINQIKFNKPSPDDLLLQLVKLKQSADKTRKKPKTLSEIKIPLAVLAEHRTHKTIPMNSCVICNDSELELDIEELLLNKDKSVEKIDIIIGEKIFKYKPPLKSNEKNIDPLLVPTTQKKEDLINANEINADNKTGPLQRKSPPTTGKFAEHENSRGLIRYALSDRSFIEKGWTMLPTEKVVRKMNVYRMRPAHPEFDWFEHNKNKKIMQYDSGEKLAEFDDNGRGRLYYRSGRLALDYYDAEEVNAQQRFVIHSSGELDARGCSRPLTILATFDYLGNGIVFDHTGKIRLKYNQTEGVVLDRSIGPVSHWKWHTLNDPPVLQQVMIDTQMAHKDPDILKLGGPTDAKPRPDNEEMLAIEFDNFVKEKSKKLSQKFKPFQIKMKALKINEHFSLRVLDQATIYLIFRDGSTNIKLNLGMILDHQEIVDTDTAEVGEVSNSLERFPARTDSLAGLQNSVAFAQRVERARLERERRITPNLPFSSSDKLTAAISRPQRTPLRTVPSDFTVATCKCRKPSSNNLYYDARFV